jgi:hypothetical protein
MNVSPPPVDAAELFAWWAPLLAVDRRLRETGEPWVLHLDEFRFRGWVKRTGKATLSVFEYGPSGRDVICDAAGNTYRYRPFEASPERGRIEGRDRDTAMFDAGVPFVPVSSPGFDDFPDPVDDEQPRRRARTARPWSRSRANLRVVRG